MTKTHRTVTTLLAVIAVLLAINLAVTAPSSEAKAQGVGRGRPAEAVAFVVREEFVGGEVGADLVAYRLWSDGTVERNAEIPQPFKGPGVFCLPVEWCGWLEIPEVPFVP